LKDDYHDFIEIAPEIIPADSYEYYWRTVPRSGDLQVATDGSMKAAATKLLCRL